MPELPEVEYTARQLRDSVIGATIGDALVYWERAIGYPDLPSFLAQIRGQSISGVRRRGKFLLLDLSGGFFLAIHRRMTGNLLLLPPGWKVDTSLQQTDPAAWKTRGPSFYRVEQEDEGTTQIEGVMEQVDEGTSAAKVRLITARETGYCRVCFNLVDGRRLLFTDPRKFGRVELWPLEGEGEAFKDLGPEPLSEEFTVARLAQVLAGHKRPIKQVLLLQEVVAGLGNIYADEALYFAAIHPLQPANALTWGEIEVLHAGIVSTLTLAIEHGGTSFSEYRDLWGEAGDNYNHVQVYQQEGKPCPRCGSVIERMVIAHRSAHFCPGCQRRLTGV